MTLEDFIKTNIVFVKECLNKKWEITSKTETVYSKK